MSKENLIVFLLVICIAVSSVSLAMVFLKTPPEQPELINTIGTASDFVKPDVAYVTVGVTATKVSASDALDEANAKMSAVKGALLNAGIKDEEMQTTSFWVNAEYNYESQPPRIVGYTVNNNFTVKTSAEKASSVITIAAKSGATNFYDFRFAVSEENKIKQALLPKAIEDAKKNAETMATAINKKVKSFKVVSYEFVSPRTDYYGEISGAGGYETPVSIGQNEVQVKVYATFELQD